MLGFFQNEGHAGSRQLPQCHQHPHATEKGQPSLSPLSASPPLVVCVVVMLLCVCAGRCVTTLTCLSRVPLCLHSA